MKKLLTKPILSVSNVSIKFNQTEVLKNIKFTLSSGEKLGLIGPNGSGKSTLLKIISEEIEKDEGTITIQKNLKIKYLPQFHIGEHALSPGEVAKKILSAIISSNAGIYLLDEPTNNLDIKGLEMIERFIEKSDKSFIIVSHDREFLDRIVTRIVEIDPVTKTANIYSGNYSEYSKEREARIINQWKEYKDKIEKVEKFRKNIDKRLTWMKDIEQKRKNNKNLPIHEKEKPEAAMLRDQEGRAGKRARMMKDRLEKYQENSEDIVRQKHLLPPKIEFDDIPRGSDKVFALKDVVINLGKKKIGSLTINIQYGDRLHIQGANGAGKTTLLKIIVGEKKPDKGEIVTGENVRVAYIPQERWNDRSSKRVIEDFMEVTEIEQGNARKILNRFRLTTEDIKKEINVLSPGEYSRLIIAELVAKKPNCIILDEPTNHLDLEILEELEKGLLKYSGTLIIVSHDRYFVERINVNRSLVLG